MLFLGLKMILLLNKTVNNGKVIKELVKHLTPKNVPNKLWFHNSKASICIETGTDSVVRSLCTTGIYDIANCKLFFLNKKKHFVFIISHQNINY